ncbi:Hypothetical protein A7982_08181 [Minicystis rosea]|nr:Hypothetical protein A7982_08181 [Minicystis rosea]
MSRLACEEPSDRSFQSTLLGRPQIRYPPRTRALVVVTLVAIAACTAPPPPASPPPLPAVTTSATIAPAPPPSATPIAPAPIAFVPKPPFSIVARAPGSAFLGVLPLADGAAILLAKRARSSDDAGGSVAASMRAAVLDHDAITLAPDLAAGFPETMTSADDPPLVAGRWPDDVWRAHGTPCQAERWEKGAWKTQPPSAPINGPCVKLAAWTTGAAIAVVDAPNGPMLRALGRVPRAVPAAPPAARGPARSSRSVPRARGARGSRAGPMVRHAPRRSMRGSIPTGLTWYAPSPAKICRSTAPASSPAILPTSGACARASRSPGRRSVAPPSSRTTRTRSSSG